MSAPGPSASSTPSGRPSRRASVGAMAAIQRTITPTRAPRKKRAAADLIGRRISISWPQDKSFYDARCIDYNPRTKYHKVLYYSDDSIEELSLAKRKWKPVDEVIPDPDPEGRHALLGQLIILPAKSSDTLNPAEPEKDFRACVHDVIIDDEPVEPPSDPAATLAPKPVMHLVVYLANDFIATVDLSSVKYIVIDNVRGEVIRTVNPEKGPVELEPPEPALAAVLDASVPANARGPGPRGRVEEEIVSSGNADHLAVVPTTNADVMAKGQDDDKVSKVATQRTPKENETTASAAMAPKDLPSSVEVAVDQSATQPHRSVGDASETAPDVAGKFATELQPSVPQAPTPGATAKLVSATEAASVHEAASLEAQYMQPTPPSMSAPAGNEKTDPTPTEPVEAESVPGTLVEQQTVVTAQGSTKFVTQVEAAGMAASAADAAAAMAEIEEEKVAEKAAVVFPDISMDEFPEPGPSNSNIAALVSGPFGGAVPAPAPTPGNTATLMDTHANGSSMEAEKKEDSASPGAIVFGSAVDTAMLKPLTEENLNLLDSATKAEIKPTKAEMKATKDETKPTIAEIPGPILPATIRVYEKDEDTNTVSDAEDAAWVANSPRTTDVFAQSRVSKYIALTVGESQRKAYVEAYFQPKQTHFVAFCDATGGNMQVRLTEENHRLLTEKEIDTLSKRLALDVEHPSPNRNRGAGSARGSRRRSSSARDDDRMTVNKRARRASSPKEIGPGSELVGECITVRWPGNGGNYVALVVGFQDNGLNNRMHKVYYVADESTEVLDLSKREWVKEGPGTEPWDRNGLVGKRLFVYWHGEYAEEFVEDQRRSEEKFGKGKTKVPFEAFVVQFIDSFRYRLLYTQDDNLEDRDLTQEDQAWDVLEPGVMKVDDMSVISWSSPITATS